jgi:CheY-like chemotaxis protein
MNAQLRILFIEDDAIEIMKFERTLRTLNMNHTITVAENGEVAMEKLLSGEYLPELILLDLNMPKMNGVEFLSFLKNDDRFYHIPAVILTTSNNRNDIIQCYKAGISGYMIKPLKYEDYLLMIERLLAYWSVNELKAEKR